MQDLTLDTRTGLPDHFRVLLSSYPREAWEQHSNFNGLTRFWMERHLMFRDLQTRLRTETETFLDQGCAPQAYGGTLYQLANAFIGNLHGHHQIEDAHYFPLLSAREARLEQAFALLDRDHHALDPLLAELTGLANDVLKQIGRDGAAQHSGAQDAAGRFHAAIGRFGGFLDRHLTDEEDIVVPVILAHGADDLQ